MTNIDSKRIVRNTIFLYLRMFLSMAVSLYTVRVVLQTLNAGDYGIYSAVGGVVLTFSVVANILTNASQRFFSYELGKNDNVNICKSLFSTIFYTYVLLVFIIILIAETIGIWFLRNKMIIPIGRDDAAMWVFQFTLISFCFSLLTNPFQAMIIAKEKMGIYAYISIADVILKLLIVYCLVAFDYDQLKIYALLVALVHIFINVLYVFFCVGISSEARLIKKIDRTTLKSIFSYSSWTLFGALTGMCNTQGINIVLNVFWGPIANTAYSISSQVSSVVTSFAGNFALAIKPPLIKSFAAEDYSASLRLFYLATRVTFLLMYMIILPLLINAPEILKLWLGNVSEYMVDFVRLTLVYSLVLTLSNPITNIVQAAGKVKIYHCIVDGFTLVSLPLIIFLYKNRFDINYCYYVIIAIFSIAHVIRLLIMKRVLTIFSIKKYVESVMVPIIFITVSSLVVMMYIRNFLIVGLWETVISCFVAFILVVSLCVLFLFAKNERQYLFRMLLKN